MNLGQRNKVSASGNMSSMTDLVFLLLIFFVILSTLASKGVNVDLPQSKGVTSKQTKLQLTIAVGEKYSLDKVQIAKEDIEGVLKAKMDEREDKTLYLVVDKNVPTGATVEMIGLAKENKWQVLLGSSAVKK
tara:strand:+ start:143 stop:538 length:396 start_codon:yes stop_codon:yes gene_type:complete